MLHDLHLCPLKGKKMLFEINWDYRPTEVKEQHPLRCPHHGVASIIWRKRWKKARQTREISPPNQQEKLAEHSPVQATDHIPHSIDETLVFLRVTDDEAVELLHIGINRVQSRRLSATCMATAQDAGSKRSFSCHTCRLWQITGMRTAPGSGDTAGNAQSHGKSFSWWESTT